MYHASVTGLINRDSEKRKRAVIINRQKAEEIQTRPVIMKDENKKILAIFSSLKIAGEITLIPQQNIGEVCRGKRNSAGGYYWEYANKDIYNQVTQEIV